MSFVLKVLRLFAAFFKPPMKRPRYGVIGTVTGVGQPSRMSR